MTDSADRYQRAAAASRRARGLRLPTEAEAARLRELGAAAVGGGAEAKAERDAFVYELYRAGVGPTDIARELPGEAHAKHMHRTQVQRIVKAVELARLRAGR